MHSCVALMDLIIFKLLVGQKFRIVDKLSAEHDYTT